MLTRRAWLSLSIALAASRARANSESSLLTTRELSVPGAPGLPRKCLLIRPSHVDPAQALPLLVLLHGLGETGSEALGVRAWFDRYGLPEAYGRLASGKVLRTLPRVRYLSDQRSSELNQELAREPFPDLAIACPFTPNVWKQPQSSLFLDRYAEYLEQALLPTLRATTPTLPGALHLGLDGVSLGGYVALEIFQRKPELFAAVGSMQGAFSVQAAERYAARLAPLLSGDPRCRIHLTTSSQDPYRNATLRLAQRLQERGIRLALSVPDGPHDQSFLREVGSLEMLFFQARALTRA